MTPWPDSCDFPRLVYSRLQRGARALLSARLPGTPLPMLSLAPELRYTTHTRLFQGSAKKGWQKLPAATGVAFPFRFNRVCHAWRLPKLPTPPPNHPPPATASLLQHSEGGMSCA